MKRVLLVDDDEINNFFNRHLILKGGFATEVIVAENGKKGLDILKRDPWAFDMVFLDLNMPVMNGFEVLEEIDLVYGDTWTGKPVIMLTTSDEERDKRRANTYRCLSGYYQKPLSKDTLTRIIEDYSEPVQKPEGGEQRHLSAI